MNMKRTDEQTLILAHHGNARIKALAGAGKTSTLVWYALSRSSVKILYIAYNRSVKDEAIVKFKKAGIKNVRVETAHSLAYKEFDVKTKFILHPSGGCKPFELLDMVEVTRITKKDSQYGLILLRHTLEYMSLFCNSNANNLKEIDYLSKIQDDNAKSFVKSNIDNISYLVSIIMNQMLKGKIKMSHDVYLKYWQLSKPHLDYAIIMFDEGQDASPVMLDVFLSQEHAVKIIVGDEHQQIYSFRSAVNSLSQVDYPEFYLTNSFRFPQHIADIAMEAINLKSLLGIDVSKFRINGLGTGDNVNNLSATLARNNITLLISAIEAVFENNVERIYFEGNLSSYTYMKEGGNLYDILNLFQENHSRIKDPLISSFKSILELEEYQEATNDHEIKLMANIVKKYGGKLTYYLSNLKKHQVEKEKAQMIFSTVHKAKGMEYRSVTLCDDFINKESIIELLNPAVPIADLLESQIKDGDDNYHNQFDSHEKKGVKKQSTANIAQITEEINILYVALTRAQEELTATDFT